MDQKAAQHIQLPGPAARRDIQRAQKLGHQWPYIFEKPDVVRQV